jgi:adenosyl cobinamide kinase/adenosyl cobinamide phosphate guanylyltransferase
MSSPQSTDATLIHDHMSVLYEVEKLSTSISKIKSKKIVLDSRRQKNREALRSIQTLRNSDDIDNDTVMIDMSGTMVRLTLDIAEKYLSEQQEQIEKNLILATKELKQLVADLQLVAPSRGVDPKDLELILAD